MKYPDVDVGKVFHLNKMLINKSFRRFWIQTKDFRIRCSEYGFNLNKPRADILIIPGLSEFIERYDQIAIKLTERNFRVSVIDLPGQGLSTRFGNPKQVIDVDTFQFYWDAIEAVVLNLDLGKQRGLIFLGNSLGGFLSIKYQISKSSIFLSPSLTICLAPMMGLPVSSILQTFILYILKVLNLFKLSKRKIPSNLASIFSAFGLVGKNVKTSLSKASAFWEKPENIEYYGKSKVEDATKHFINNQDLETEGPSWNWVGNAIVECRSLFKINSFSNYNSETLLILADDEYVTDPKAQEKALKIIPNVNLLRLPSCRHDIIHEKDEVQEKFWKGIDEFIEKNKLKFETVHS